MSFQGDVGGIGLAELLQSLARGRREGRLTLIGKTRHATLGLKGGQLHLLPEPDEDPEVWRNRARRAWADEPEQRVDTLRMGEIAQANRLENLYRLLDSEGANFRFTPGQLGTAREDGVEEVLGPPLPVEYVLLDYARLSDDGERIGASRFDDQLVPRPLDAASAGETERRFFQQCDGTSDLVEIADRLGWPLRQVRTTVAEHFGKGKLRLAQPRELLALTVKELGRAQFERAASRITAWVRFSPGGPPIAEDGALLAAEWRAGRLQRILPLLDKPIARRLVRRMELGRHAPGQCIEHWEELAKVFLHGQIIEMHLVALKVRDDTNEKTPELKELLNVARGMREKGHPKRAAILLRLAAERAPSTVSACLEVGTGLLAVGLVPEAAPWILEAATQLVEAREYDKAVPPLRALLEQDPRNRDARRLYSRARNNTTKSRVLRKHTLIGMAVLVAIGAGALVQIRVDRDRERKIAEITNRIQVPPEALALLQVHFPDDQSPEVQTLRETIFERQRALESATRQAWNDRYREAQLEVTLGDPLLGLTRALELPKPPELAFSTEPWPLVSDLFNGLAARLEELITDLGAPAEGDTEQIHTEEKLAKQVDALKRQAAERAAADAERHAEALGAFATRLDAIGGRLVRRGETRAAMATERLRKRNLAEQDIQLAAARAHRQAGDLGRAMASYEALLELDGTGKLNELRELREEIRGCRKQHEALKEARRLAHAGRHPAAIALLREELDRPELYLLPARIESFPPGARATLRDGTVKTTPFELMSTIDERVQMTLTLDDHEPIALELTEPTDRFVWLSRTPERAWPTKGEVHAPPVAVARDHIVCDRAGTIRRIAASGAPVWEQRLGSLGGVARTPVFLTRRPGHLLVLTEDGEAWILDAASGELEGPWATGSPPVAGPHPFDDGAIARFADGRVAVWHARIKPEETFSARATDAPEVEAGTSEAGLAVLRRASDASTELASPWTPHVATVGAEVFTVTAKGSDAALFTVGRQGEWQYLAWEAPHAGVPSGRLWISDGAGLRAFQP